MTEMTIAADTDFLVEDESAVAFEERVANAASDYETLDAEWIVGVGVDT